MRQCFPKCVPQTLLSQDVNKYICKVTSKEFEKQGVARISSLVIFLGFEYTSTHWSPRDEEIPGRGSQNVNERQFWGNLRGLTSPVLQLGPFDVPV